MEYQNQTQKLPILIVGATGRLGALITKHALLNPNLLVNILVRNPQKNPELVNSVEKAGGRVIQGDVENPETLKGVAKGIHTVISATSQIDEKIALHGQIALIDECVRSGVERIVPSAYAENLEEVPIEEQVKIQSLAFFLKVWDYLQQQPIKSLRISPGLFVDSFFEIHTKEYGYWGDKEHRYDLTTYEDTAKVVVAAVAQKERTGHVVINGNDLNIIEITEIYNRVRGTNITPKELGTFEDLKAKWEEANKVDRTSFEAVILGIYALIYDDRCKFHKNNNSDFPEIKLTTIEEYLNQNPQVKLPSSN